MGAKHVTERRAGATAGSIAAALAKIIGLALHVFNERLRAELQAASRTRKRHHTSGNDP